jgi:hypothetical protein
MLSKREAVWNELNSVLKKRKAAHETDTGGGRQSTPAYKQTPFSFVFPPGITSQRKSSLSDITFLLVKFICLGLFAMSVTRNPGFIYLVQQLTIGVKLSSPNTVQRRLLKEFADLVTVRKEFFEANKNNDAPDDDNDVDLDPHIYCTIESFLYSTTAGPTEPLRHFWDLHYSLSIRIGICKMSLWDAFLLGVGILVKGRSSLLPT